MNQAPWPGTDSAPLRLTIVASDPVWIGAARRGTLGRRGGGPKWQVDLYDRLADTPTPRIDERQFLLVEVNRDTVVATSHWLFRRRPLASRWRVGILLSRAPGDFSGREIASASALLREAGASHVVATVWDLPAIISWGERFQGANRTEGGTTSLPIAITAEGWQLAGRRV